MPWGLMGTHDMSVLHACLLLCILWLLSSFMTTVCMCRGACYIANKAFAHAVSRDGGRGEQDEVACSEDATVGAHGGPMGPLPHTAVHLAPLTRAKSDSSNPA